MIELLTQIVHFVWDLLPRPVMVHPISRAACFWFGRWGRDKGPGWYIIWPLIQHWRIVIVASQLCETAVIPVTDASGRDWQFRLVVEYGVHDVLVHEIAQFSGQNHLEQLVGSAMVVLITGQTTDEILRVPMATHLNLVKERVADQATQRGITVLAVRAVMAARCRSFFVSQAERLTD